MELIKLTELGYVPNDEKKEITMGNATIEIKKCLPYEQILDMMQLAMSLALGDRPFVSMPIYEISSNLVLVKGYTNLDLSKLDAAELSPKDLYETYDILINKNIISQVKDYIDAGQLKFYETTLKGTIDNLIAYRNSAVGMVDTLAANSKQNADALNQSLDMINDPDKFTEVRKIVELMDKE